MVAFRAGIWNLGGDGQFLLAAVSVAAAAHQGSGADWRRHHPDFDRSRGIARIV
jgi:ABC-type uncharacterized transport system permease subunit